jgi:hypothetical protein
METDYIAAIHIIRARSIAAQQRAERVQAVVDDLLAMSRFTIARSHEALARADRALGLFDETPARVAGSG